MFLKIGIFSHFCWIGWYDGWWLPWYCTFWCTIWIAGCGDSINCFWLLHSFCKKGVFSHFSHDWYFWLTWYLIFWDYLTVCLNHSAVTVLSSSFLSLFLSSWWSVMVPLLSFSYFILYFSHFLCFFLTSISHSASPKKEQRKCENQSKKVRKIRLKP